MSEAIIRKVWSKCEDICKRSALMSEEAKKKTFRASVGRFTEVEDKLYLWIYSMRRVNLLVPPSLAILKAKLSQTLFGNPKGPVELGNPNTCAETKLCLNFILFRLKK